MTDAAEREMLQTDVVIVGAGPAGLAAAIRLKQKSPELSVTVLEKAAEIGGHVLSGAVMDPAGLAALFPDWRQRNPPVGPDVTRDEMFYLTPSKAFAFPHQILPPQMKTRNALIISLGRLCQWLGEQAAELGVDIFPMTAAVDVLTSPEGAVTGVITGDLGVDQAGNPKDGYAQGVGIEARYTLLGEGARGSLAKMVIERFDLAAGRAPQKYGLGIKEIWQVDDTRHELGRVEHYLGYPLDDKTSGGGFVYHAENNQLYVGLVVHLDYENPTLSPFDEFQRFKKHPRLEGMLDGGECISYGARALTSGGWQSIPKLAFPGGALMGCSAGFLNAPRLKAIHNAMFSGIATADAVGAAIADGRQHDEIDRLEDRVMETGIAAELKPVRNVKPLWSRFGTRLGVALSGMELWSQALFGASPLGTLSHNKPDFAALKPLSEVEPLSYERGDGVLTRDRSASVHLANISHDEDQPVHLRLDDPTVPIEHNLPIYGEPAPLYCPAGVYEIGETDGKKVFRIHAANCVHCKTCDIKDPAQNIAWVPPEGGSGPNYSGM
ncbi:electron transfer flavoprotein-ubiquinone oxidoreductase [Devosia pacifica]|uniref:Electron transfer flavoprotein-ubiquinone oxidoreductase n=1 Tax=Devosia pacifica TaxID=1335967 RepID=A0A918SAU5_9HYPH|nr:electron transfer flavoprotein-ubiquinone oxidoreductase [Devosia pacifica]GHA30407.1 electron transfer flavoprotein-ubiquinone oxidoreductase [Devosia pacifica]